MESVLKYQQLDQMAHLTNWSRLIESEPGAARSLMASPPMMSVNGCPTLSAVLSAFLNIRREMLRPSRGRKPWLASLHGRHDITISGRRAERAQGTAHELRQGQGDRRSDPVGGCHCVKSTSGARNVNCHRSWSDARATAKVGRAARIQSVTRMAYC